VIFNSWLAFARASRRSPPFYFLAWQKHRAKASAIVDINARNPGVFVGGCAVTVADGCAVAVGVGVACPN
jgi:acyl-coenzyme A thioesterase PaaI-like protein